MIAKLMANETDIDSLFKDHSLEEIELVRDNLAGEIQKKTDALKSIVKEKYRDIIETSDAIKSMRLNLAKVEKSLWGLDKDVSDFYVKVRNHHQDGLGRRTSMDMKNQVKVRPALDEDKIARDLVDKLSDMWSSFDTFDLKGAVKHLNELTKLVESSRDVIKNSNNPLLGSLEMSSLRAKTMISNSLWYKIKSAPPDQICIMGGSDQIELYRLSLACSMEFPVNKLLKGLSDMSHRAQIRRYMQPSYFNKQTNQVEVQSTVQFSSSQLSIPKEISLELSDYLFEVCEMINKIAGFNLNYSTIVYNLRVTIEQILQVYSEVVPIVDNLKGETKRKRALQLHCDLLYVRILLYASKNVDLIEQYDPEVNTLNNKYELMLDPIEYYVISSAVHDNMMALSRSTLRLYALLIPQLH